MNSINGYAVLRAIVAILVGILVSPCVATAQTIAKYPVPGYVADARGIAAGPDGALWFADFYNSKIGRVTIDGTFSSYSLPYNWSPRPITAGPDGAMWFAGYGGIGRITMDGTIHLYSTPSGGLLQAITTGPDAAVWYTKLGVCTHCSAIGRVTSDGRFTEFVLPAPLNDGAPAGITTGPDSALWFTDSYNNKIVRMAMDGSLTIFSLPVADTSPFGIALGPDGALWFTQLAGAIGRITTAGELTEFPMPTGYSIPQSIKLGPDGALWFTDAGTTKIGRITTHGEITEFQAPKFPSCVGCVPETPWDLALGSDGALWVAQPTFIDRVQLPGQPPAVVKTVVEFYNPDLNHYFITADPAEQAAVDAGAVGRWNRTGYTFKAGVSYPVYRFFGNSKTNPSTGRMYGPNSHFYTASFSEYSTLQALYNEHVPSWKFESIDFQTTLPVGQVCPPDTRPVYRAYNNGSTRGIDSNHRFTTSQTALNEVTARGWTNEGLVMCANQD